MKHFELYEVVDKRTFGEMGEEAWGIFPPQALEALDSLREFFGAIITVNDWYWGGQFQYRGYRPPECTIGAKGSYHRKGMAFDCDVRGYTAAQARDYILGLQDDPRLQYINRLEGGKTWLHFDLGRVPEGKKRIYVFHVM